jgi:cytochrome bd-type quinol oxidase subunit 2
MKKSQITSLLGGLIVIIGTFLPYATVGGNSLNMFSMGDSAKTVAIVFIVLAGLSAIFGYFGKNKVWWLSIINLVFASIGALLIFLHIGKLHKETDLQVGMCVYIIALGFTVSLVSSLLGIMRK